MLFFLPKEIEKKVTFCPGSIKIKDGMKLTDKEMEIFKKNESRLRKSLKKSIWITFTIKII